MDVVRVGKLKHYMEKGIMLMTNHALRFSMSFEGILGLGVPRIIEEKNNTEATAHGNLDAANVQDVANVTVQKSAAQIIRDIIGGGSTI